MQCPEYRLLRDCAFALKHGELTGKPRFVRKPGQIEEYGGAFQSDAFQADAFDTGLVWVEADTDLSKTQSPVACLNAAGFFVVCISYNLLMRLNHDAD